MWGSLRTQIQTLLQTLQGTDHTPSFVEVSKAPKIRFDGYPAAHIMPSDSTGDYDTNVENVRTYAFIVRVFYETKVIGIEKALENLEGLVDQVMDLFDQEDLKQGTDRTIGINPPANYTYINIFATPGKWGEYTDEELIMSEITVKARFTVEIL